MVKQERESARLHEFEEELLESVATSSLFCSSYSNQCFVSIIVIFVEAEVGLNEIDLFYDSWVGLLLGLNHDGRHERDSMLQVKGLMSRDLCKHGSGI